MNHVHQNPVKHALVSVANQCRWCSADWFENNPSPAMGISVNRFKTEAVRVGDDLEVTDDW